MPQQTCGDSTRRLDFDLNSPDSVRMAHALIRRARLALCLAGFWAAGNTWAVDQAPTAVPAPGTGATAGAVFDRMFPDGLTPGERKFAHAALKDAWAFAVLPNMSKVGVGVSQFQGRGTLVYRDGDGGWRLPLPLRVSGTGVGPHYATITFDTLAVIRSPQALQRLLAGNTAPTGREVTGVLPDLSPETEGILAYTRSQGLSGGCSQDDIHVDLDLGAYQAMYGVTAAPKLLFEGRFDTCRKPFPAQKLADDAKIRSGYAPLTTLWVTPGYPEP